MFVCCVFLVCVFSVDSGLCDGPIILSEETNLVCMSVCDVKT